MVRDLSWPECRAGRFVMGFSMMVVAGVLAGLIMLVLGQRFEILQFVFVVLSGALPVGLVTSVAMRGGQNFWHPRR